jgi:ribosomal protein S18 acetylase RimI-like enzyme
MHPFGNFSFVSNASSLADTTEAIAALLTCAAPTAVLYAETPAPDVIQLLADKGFADPEHIPTMAVDIDDLTSTSVPDGYEFVRLTTTELSDAWTDALSIGYGLPWNVAQVFSPEAIDLDPSPSAPLQCFAILKDGKPVTTSVLHCVDGLAGIYCVATIAEDRGKGLGAHVTAEPLRLAREFGYRVGVLQASTAGYSVYERLGFQDFGVLPIFIRMPAG